MRGFEPQLLFYSLSRGLKKSKLLSLLCLLVLLSACFRYPENSGDGSQEPTDPIDPPVPSVQTDLEKDLTGRKEIIPGDTGFYVISQTIQYTTASGVVEDMIDSHTANADKYARGFYLVVESKYLPNVVIYAPYPDYFPLRGEAVKFAWYLNEDKIAEVSGELSHASPGTALPSDVVRRLLVTHSGDIIEQYILFDNFLDGNLSYIKLPRLEVMII